MSKKQPDAVAKALQNWQSPDSSNLYQHLCDLISEIPTDTVNGVIHFERISQFFKKSKFSPQQPANQSKLASRNEKVIEYPNWIVKQDGILREFKKLIKNSNTDACSDRTIQNFERDNLQLFSGAGYSFGKEQSYRIQAALKLLAEKHNTKTLRFFGKILGRENDYYVIQGQAKKNRNPEKTTNDMQGYGQGVNYYSFWVAKSILSDPSAWLQLPMITPQQMKISRLVKYAFTGNLMAQLKGYPKFPGEQRHILKCQLVRIAHNCEIAPNNLYAKNEQNQDIIQFSEQFKMPEFADLTNLQNWVHLNPYILECGRSKYYTDPSLTQEQKEELLAKLGEADPLIQRLKPINQDKPVSKLGLQTCWFAKQCGNTQVFNNVGKDQGTTSCYGLVVLKNPHWPGWATVSNAKCFGSIYIGTGIKLTQNCFYPLTNEDLLQQGEDNDQFDEPNPRDPPDELQPDSDDENKPPEGE